MDKLKLMEEIKSLFNGADRNNTGFIDSGQVEQLLLHFFKSKGTNHDPALVKTEVASFLKGLDSNNDGQVSLSEFTKFAMKFVCS